MITVGVNVKKDDDLTTADMCKSIAHAKELGVDKPVVAIPSLEGIATVVPEEFWKMQVYR